MEILSKEGMDYVRGKEYNIGGSSREHRKSVYGDTV